MKTVDEKILDECELIEQGFPEKDCAFWHYRHKESGLDYIAMVFEPNMSAWIEEVGILEDGESIGDYV